MCVGCSANSRQTLGKLGNCTVGCGCASPTRLNLFGCAVFIMADHAEDVEDSGSDHSEIGPTDEWDDGEECRDEDWSVQLYCALCGYRPRPEHDFRCRLHDEVLSNGQTRPRKPMQPSMEESEAMTSAEWVAAMEAHDAAMAEHKAQMDRWQPEWSESINGPSCTAAVAGKCYALPCVRCGGSTVLEGSHTMGFQTDLETLKRNSPWLPEAFGEGINGRVNTSTGEVGRCVRCQLIVSINPGGEE